MIYINYRFNSQNETIDSAETLHEAIDLLRNYQLSDRYGEYWISRKKCKYGSAS
jgi:hypothetical protein